MSQTQDKKVVSWRELFKGLCVLIVLGAIVVAFVACFIIFAGPGIVSFFSTFSTLDTGVIVALIAGAVSIITLVGGGILNIKMKRDEYLYKRREIPYMQLISMFYDFQSRTISGEEFSQEELRNIYTQVTKDLTLWGSSKAIKTWGKWRVSAGKKGVDPKGLLFGMEAVMIQLRKDMGLKRGIKKGDLLRLTVNDIDDYVQNT